MSYNTLVEAQAVNASITQAMLDSATLYLNSRYTWQGVLADTAQDENWPRLDSCGNVMVDINGRELSGVPSLIKSAEIALAELVLGGDVLLPTTVAVATTASSTAGGELIEKTVKSGDEQVTRKWSSTLTDSTSAAISDFDDNGLPIIVSIDAMLRPITDIKSAFSGSNYLLGRM